MNLAIYGAGGLGRELLELARQINETSPRWDKMLFVVDREYYNSDNSIINGIEVITFETAKIIYSKDELELVIAQGEPIEREKLKRKIDSTGYNLTTLIHPNVYIPQSAKIGVGVIIQSNCFISCNTTIKDNALIQGSAILGHDASVGYNSVVSSLCLLAGGVTVGNETYLGVNTVIKEKLIIGSNTIIGMGSSVFRNIENNVIALGNPARIIKRNENNKVFG